MTEGVYPDGMPHPPESLRLRVVAELAVLAALTVLFLYNVEPNIGTYLGMALIGAALVGFNANEIRQRFWGPPSSPEFDRVRRCALNMSVLTIPPVLLFLCYGLIVGKPILWLNFAAALLFYIPWALLQQTLFQFFLLGRLRVLLPFASPLLLSVINGIFYGMVHWSDWTLVLMTTVGGIFWSYSYHRDRYVLPIALSHALLASTFFYFVRKTDLIGNLYHQLFS